MAQRTRKVKEDEDSGRNEGQSPVTKNVFMEHFERCSALRADLDSANGEYRSAIKAAGEAGVNRKQLIRAIMAKRQDATALRQNEQDWRTYAGWLGLPIDVQTEMAFSSKAPTAAPDPAVDAGYGGEPSEAEMRAANLKGFDAGKAGRDFGTNPYPLNSPQSDAWREGFKNGQKQVAADGRAGRKKVNGEGAAVSKPRRQRGAAAEAQTPI